MLSWEKTSVDLEPAVRSKVPENNFPTNGIPFRDGGKLSYFNEYYYGNGNLLAMWHTLDPSQGNGWGVASNPKKHFTYYHKDVLGSVVLTTVENSSPKQHYQYDAFGNPYSGHFLHNPNNNNPYGFTGQRYEPELGVYAFPYREYNLHAMRWMTVDPVKDGANWYQYVGSDPVNYVDPLGLALEESGNVQSSRDSVSYILYTTNWKSNFARQASYFKFKLQKEGKTVITHRVNTVEAFEKAWNGMGVVNGTEVDIDEVIILSHGSERSLILKDGSSTNALSVDGLNLSKKPLGI
jgi:RHS repeat-associated protein